MFLAEKDLICTIGEAFLSKQGYDLARGLYAHGINGRGEALPIKTQELMIERLKSSKILTALINSFIANATGYTFYEEGSVHFIPEGEDLEDCDHDLYYAIQHANYIISGVRHNGGWAVTVTIWDTYDFDHIRLIEKVGFANAANDLGWSMQQAGMMTPYEFSVTYTIFI